MLVTPAQLLLPEVYHAMTWRVEAFYHLNRVLTWQEVIGSAIVLNVAFVNTCTPRFVSSSQANVPNNDPS